MKPFTSLAVLVLAGLAAAAAPHEGPQGQRGEGVPAFWVRPGFKVTLAAENFGQSRFLVVDPAGTLYVSQPDTGTITALRDNNNDGVYETHWKVLENHRTVHGLQVVGDWLYFTTSGAIYRAPFAEPGKPLSNIQTVIAEGEVPSGGGHWWRSILVDGDKLWTSIGDSGNITDEASTDRQKIWQFQLGPDGKAKAPKLWSSGIRNTEKLQLRPGTTEVWGADHGSDNIGARYGEKGGGPITDVYPPCEFNHYVEGFNYGHPFVTGLGFPRPEYANRSDILQRVEANTPPAWSLGAHWAPNGWTFLRSDALFGKSGDALIALHGSWNARRKVGYRIERIVFDEVTGRPMGSQMIVGTLDGTGTDVLGRPCDVLELPDGTVLFTDNGTARIYRLTRTK
jgi:glucose/arabinose dehydrogenase